MFNRVHWENFQFEHNLTAHIGKHDFPNHHHVLYEILYIISGTGVFLIEDAAYEFSPQTVFLVPPGNYHFMKVLPDCDYERCVVNFAADALSDKIKKPLNPLCKNADERIQNLFFKFDCYADEFGGDALQALHLSLLNELVINLAGSGARTGAEAIALPPLVSAAEAYIDKHLDEPLSVKMISENIFCSPSRLHHVFSETMGTGVMRYVRIKKMYRARELLGQGISAAAVAERLGYNDYPTFYKNFRAVFHCAPNTVPPAI